MKELHKRLEREALNAYLDGELSSDETIQFERHLNENRAQQKLLDELRRVKLLAQCAMHKQQHGADIDTLQPMLPRRPSRQNRYILFQALAAGLLMVVGLLVGLNLQTQSPPTGLQTYLTTGKLVTPLAAQTDNRVEKAVYHIRSVDPVKIRGALDEMEFLLSSYAKSGKTLHLEIIANAGGLDLLRADTSPASDRVYAMQQTYKNLKFLACGKTIERLKLEKNLQKVHLLPGVTVVPSALDQVILRLENGWSYIRA